MLIYIDLLVLLAIRNYNLEGKDCHYVQICTLLDHKGLTEKEEVVLRLQISLANEKCSIYLNH